jgi:hypothetical protein
MLSETVVGHGKVLLSVCSSLDLWVNLWMNLSGWWWGWAVRFSEDETISRSSK